MKRMILCGLCAAAAVGALTTASLGATASATTTATMAHQQLLRQQPPPDGRDWRDPSVPRWVDRHCGPDHLWHDHDFDDRGHPDDRCRW